MDKRIKILLADANEEFSQLLAASLNEETELTVVGSSTGADALRLIGETSPDVVIMDVILAGADGLGLLGEIMKLPEKDRPEVIVLSAFYSERVI